MTLSHLFAHCDDALCAAEDTAVAFFAPKTLKKFRVERFSGARVAGLYIQRMGKDNVLHVVDAEGNWFAYATKTNTLLSSATLQLASVLAPPPAAEPPKPVIASRRTDRQPGAVSMTAAAAAGPAPAATDSGILMAHFHESDGLLRCVVLTATGVSEAVLQTAAVSGLKATPILAFPIPLSDCVLAVGQRTGLVCVAQRGQRWLQLMTLANRAAIATASASSNATTASLPPHTRRVLPIAVESLSCSPANESAAVGGSRGELIVFPDVADSHYFSDHWHHTPLTALSFSVDGMSLLTGARESVLLVWNLSSYTHRKVSCNLGPIRCAAPSASAGSTVLLACGVATLATVDLLQMRLHTAVEGIEWASGQACRGLVVESWMGRPVVVLTGLPNVLRLCDPLTQQAIYSLHISAQMETVPSPPRHGIQFAGLLRDGRVAITCESFPGTALPPMLRFWLYDASRRQHVEAQTVYRPHDSEVLELCVDKAKGRVFTLSRDTVKCWEEVREDPNDVLRLHRSSWRNASTSPAPSTAVASMTLSADGSLCLVADDAVHVYSVADCRPGERWPEVVTLCQSTGVQPLRDLVLLSGAANVQAGCVAVVARDDVHVYVWNLAKTAAPVAVYTPADAAAVTALCAFTPESVLVATSSRAFVELGCCAAQLGEVLGEVRDAVAHPVQHMASLPSGPQGHIALVDAVTGFRVLSVSVSQRALEEVRFTAAGLREDSTSDGATTTSTTLDRYFSEMAAAESDIAKSQGSSEEAAGFHAAARTTRAGAWLKSVLQEPAYTAPSMSSVMSLYLKQRSGTN